VPRILVEKSEGKNSLQDLSLDGDKIKWILKEVAGISLTDNRDQCRGMRIVVTFRVSTNVKNVFGNS
jgi:hypothetical protein